jgi:uncharacterized protein YoxC
MSKLSDEEIHIIGTFLASQDLAGLVVYINRVLKKKEQTLDRCARPFALRNKYYKYECFAKGYLEKVTEYIKNIHGREPEKTVDKTITYIAKLIEEVDKFLGENDENTKDVFRRR